MTIPQLRPYQQTVNTGITDAWTGGARNVLAVMPTGGGKTVNMARLFADHRGASIAIAHRQELVGQISLALARNGVRHRVVGPSALARNIVSLHISEVGRSFYDPSAWCGVAGVDTLVRRPANDPWFTQITLWQQDEAHHVLSDNKWGKAATLFPNARGVGWTATPGRADGYGLGRDADGIMDAMVTGPTMRDLINARFLTEYRLLCPPSDIDFSNVPIGDSGDFSGAKLRAATHESHIVGDVVATYQRIATGKLGITFAVDVEHASEMAAAYRAAGVGAEVVTSKTPDVARSAILRRFRNREILQLVNVDLFGEGFDLPAIEVVSMARATASFPLYAQQFGRALRLLEGKTHGIILDHVGNTVRHGGPPDKPRAWTLDRRERRGPHLPADGELVRACPKCAATYERFRKACPSCQWAPVPLERSTPAAVEGDLVELDADVLKALRGELARVDGIVRIPEGLAGPIGGRIARVHTERQTAQATLRSALFLWSGWRRSVHGETDSEIQRRFWFTFGVDYLTAQTLGAREAGELESRVSATLAAAGVVAAA